MLSSDDDLLPSGRKTLKTSPGPMPPTKRKHQRQKSVLRMNKHDVRVVAPYLWERSKQPSKKATDTPSSIPIVLTDFSMDLADIAQLPQRMYNTANLLKQLTESTGVKLYLVDKILNEIYFCPRGQVVSGHRISWSIRSGKTIAAHVAYSKEFVLANDVFGDSRFPEGTGWGDPTLTSVICVPVITRNDECSGVIELFRDNGIDYVKLNLDVVTVISGWMGSAIEQQQKRIILERREDINTKLMTLMQRFISSSITFDEVIAEILNASKSSINAQRGSFYLLNKTSGELETLTYDEALYESMNTTVLKKLRKKIKGIAHMAVDDGQMLNIADAYTDPRFDKTVDQKSGFLTRSVLCMPIADQAGCTGVIQIINKLPAGAFSCTDEEMFRIFATYCANIVNYKNQLDEKIRAVNFNNVYRDLMENRLRFKLINTPVKTPNRESFMTPPDFQSFNWYPFPNYMDEMVELSFHMFNEIMGASFFNPHTLLAMIITVKQMYRRITYHNFEHAFSFTHCVYCILKRETERFDMVEKLALLLGGICHDLDHPGYTNYFLEFTCHPLSYLYKDACLENHHAFVGSMIIKNTRVLNMLDADTTSRFYNQFYANIRSTDLKAHVVEHRIALESILRPADEISSIFDWYNETHRQLLRYLIMTSADMAGTSKPFRVAERIAENLFVEFFNQGDRMKAMNRTPIPTMDRSLAHMLPEWQVNFLRVISLPCFDLIRLVLPETSPLYTNGKLLKKAWSEVASSRRQSAWNHV